MTISNYIQIVIIILAVICFCWAWNIETPYGGDAGLGDAIGKLFGYGAAILLALIVALWLLIYHFF